MTLFPSREAFYFPWVSVPIRDLILHTTDQFTSKWYPTVDQNSLIKYTLYQTKLFENHTLYSSTYPYNVRVTHPLGCYAEAYMYHACSLKHKKTVMFNYKKSPKFDLLAPLGVESKELTTNNPFLCSRTLQHVWSNLISNTRKCVSTGYPKPRGGFSIF